MIKIKLRKGERARAALLRGRIERIMMFMCCQKHKSINLVIIFLRYGASRGSGVSESPEREKRASGFLPPIIFISIFMLPLLLTLSESERASVAISCAPASLLYRSLDSYLFLWGPRGLSVMTLSV